MTVQNDSTARPGLLAKGYAAERRAGITGRATPSSTQAGGFRPGSPGDAGDPVDWLARYG